jgi:hypothetical protein
MTVHTNPQPTPRLEQPWNSEGSGQMSENIFVGEYTLLEQLHLLGGFLDTFSVLYPRSRTSTSASRPTSLEAPGYLAQATRHQGAPNPPWSGSTCWRPRTRSSSPSTPPGTGPCGSSPPSSTT